ncbi:MAG: hypothetical protein MI739_14370 [Bacteroidales bacterium]|nr:hypothetical protein [Bacteroidales bacterium]
MKKLLYILIALIALSCEEEKLTPSESESFYKIDTNTELGKKIAQIHSKYNSYLLYKYSEADHKRISYYDFYNVIPQDSTEVINTCVEFANEYFYELFDAEIMAKYAPFKLLLARKFEQKNTTHNSALKDIIIGYNTVIISNFNGKWKLLTPEQKKSYKNKIKFAFIKDYLLAYKYMSIPDEFGKVSPAKYGQYIPGVTAEMYKQEGFWPLDNGFLRFSYPRSILVDASEYIYKMNELTHEQVLAQIQSYPLMVKKYNILRDWMIKNKIQLN